MSLQRVAPWAPFMDSDHGPDLGAWFDFMDGSEPELEPEPEPEPALDRRVDA